MMRRNHNSECRSRGTAYFVSIVGRRIRSQQWNCWIHYKVVQMNTTWNLYRNISINCDELRLKYGVQAFWCFIAKSCREVLLRQVVCEKIFTIWKGSHNTYNSTVLGLCIYQSSWYTNATGLFSLAPSHAYIFPPIMLLTLIVCVDSLMDCCCHRLLVSSSVTGSRQTPPHGGWLSPLDTLVTCWSCWARFIEEAHVAHKPGVGRSMGYWRITLRD